MYLGEITRNILLSLIDSAPKPLLFNGNSSQVLNAHYGLDTAVMSEIESTWAVGRPRDTNVKPVEGGHDPTQSEATHERLSDVNGASDSESSYFLDVDRVSLEDQARLERIRGIIIQRLSLDAKDVSLRDAAIVRWAISLVADRAAKLSSCAIATVLIQTGRAKLGGGLAPEEERVIVGVDGR